jgi:hypothetical protein
MKYPKEKKRKTNNDVQNTKQKRQTMIYKILNRKLQTEQHNSTKKSGDEARFRCNTILFH